MKTRFEPRLPRMSSWKKLRTLDPASILSMNHQSRYYRFPQINISSIQNCHSCRSFTGFADLFPQLGASHQQLCGPSMYLALMVRCQNTYNWCRGPGFKSWLWSLFFFHADILGILGSNLVFIVPFGTSYVEFRTEVWLVPFGIM